MVCAASFTDSRRFTPSPGDVMVAMASPACASPLRAASALLRPHCTPVYAMVLKKAKKRSLAVPPISRQPPGSRGSVPVLLCVAGVGAVSATAWKQRSALLTCAA